MPAGRSRRNQRRRAPGVLLHQFLAGRSDLDPSAAAGDIRRLRVT
ncbi:hypothetical protein [Deinococcus sp.]